MSSYCSETIKSTCTACHDSINVFRHRNVYSGDHLCNSCRTRKAGPQSHMMSMQIWPNRAPDDFKN